jgi:phosphonate transport system substrate-binding protein
MKFSRRGALTAAAALVSLAALIGANGCGDKGTAGGDAGPGAAKEAARPTKLVFGFIPSIEADKIAEEGKPIADAISKAVGLPVETFTSTDYAGMIEAMGSGKVDIASLNTLGYVLAKDQNAADVILMMKRKGKLTYRSVFMARADSGIKNIEQAKGKRMAFVDPNSTSGYLFAAAYLKKRGYDPDTFFSKVTFAGAHDTAIRAVYDGSADVCAVYDDARNIVERSGIKDIKQKVVIIGDAGEIPNDTVSVRPGLPADLKAKITKALIDYAHTPEGKKVLEGTYEVDDVVETTDSAYDPVREVAKAMDLNLNSLRKPSPAPSPSPAATAAGAPPGPAAKKP